MTNRRNFITALAVGAIPILVRPSLAFSPQSTIDLIRDCGAIGGGADASNAFICAFEKVKQGISSTITIDGRHSVLRAQSPGHNFLNVSSGLILEGYGSRSIIYPQQYVGGFAFPFGNLEAFDCHDLYFATTSQDKAVDCGPVFLISTCMQATFRSTHFCGLSARGSRFGLLYSYNTAIQFDNCNILGCGATGPGVITIERWLDCRISHCQFHDYVNFQEQGYLAKPSANAWIGFTGKALGVGPTSVSQGFYAGIVPVIEYCEFDEGSGRAIDFRPDPTGPKPRGLSVKHCGFNCGGLGAVYAQYCDTLLIEDSFFTYNTGNKKIIEGKGVEYIHLKRSRSINGQGIVESDGFVTAEDCKGFTFNVPSERLTVIEHGRIVR